MVNWQTEIAIRWPEGIAAHAALLKQGGVDVVVADQPDLGFRDACSREGLRIEPTPEAIPNEGLWPGIRSSGRRDDNEVASGSREPWVDSNGYRAAVLRALDPTKPAVLGYLAKAGLSADRVVPFETLELALAEAWVNGGNYLLAMDPRLRLALVDGDKQAQSAWAGLRRTAVWLKANRTWFGWAALPIVTAVCDDGAAAAEIANLLFRRIASPRLCGVGAIPAPADGAIRALVAAGLKNPSEAVKQRLYAHAAAGSVLVMDWAGAPDWKPVKKQVDRTFFLVGKGQAVVYHKPVVDPSEFALDVIDIVTHRQRAVRIWNAATVIATAARAGAEGQVTLVNYGANIEQEFPVRVQGDYRKAWLHRPETGVVELAAARRGSMTEVFVPSMGRVAVALFR
jgi:hypothetical protein